MNFNRNVIVILLLLLATFTTSFVFANSSPKDFTSSIILDLDGTTFNATLVYSWTLQRQYLTYSVDSSPVEKLYYFDLTTAYDVCGFSCTSNTSFTDKMMQLWVDDVTMSKQPYQDVVNGFIVDVYSFVQPGTTYIVTIYVIPSNLAVLRAVFLSPGRRTIFSFISTATLDLNTNPFALPSKCTSCTMSVDVILLLNLGPQGTLKRTRGILKSKGGSTTSGGGSGSDSGSASPGGTTGDQNALVKAFATATANGLFLKFSSAQIRIAIISYDLLAQRNLDFTNDQNAVLNTIQNPTNNLQNSGDEFVLADHTFVASAAQPIVIDIAQRTSTVATSTLQHTKKLEKDGVTIYAASVYPVYNPVAIASYPNFAYEIPTTSDIIPAVNALLSTLCSVSVTPPCSCVNAADCVCGTCICKSPWGNDLTQGITDCTFCTLTSAGYCNSNGVVNSDCRTCTCTKPCQNGGVRNPLTCECSCSYPWANNPTLGITDCSYCTTSNCVNCACSNPCSFSCSTHGAMQPNCTCACSSPWTNNAALSIRDCSFCPLDCGTRGSKNVSTCSCDCYSPWSNNRFFGIDNCSFCTRDNRYCNNRGILRSDCTTCDCNLRCQNDGVLSKTCSCSCPFPWGNNDATLIADCSYCYYRDHGCPFQGILDSSQCACTCPNITLTCAHGSRKKDDCACTCPDGWANDHTLGVYDCSICTRTNENFCWGRGKVEDCEKCVCDLNLVCAHGSKLSPDCTCSCEYPWQNAPDMNILNCTVCSLAPYQCSGSSILDTESCSCRCPLNEDLCRKQGLKFDSDLCICTRPKCGNNVIEMGEECDGGSCCENCKLIGNGKPCFGSKVPSHPCDARETCSNGECLSVAPSHCSTCSHHEDCSTCLDNSHCAWVTCDESVKLESGSKGSKTLCVPKSIEPDIQKTCKPSKSCKKAKSSNVPLKVGLSVGLVTASAVVIAGTFGVYLLFFKPKPVLPLPPAFSSPKPPPTATSQKPTTEIPQMDDEYLRRENPLFETPEIFE